MCYRVDLLKQLSDQPVDDQKAIFTVNRIISVLGWLSKNHLATDQQGNLEKKTSHIKEERLDTQKKSVFEQRGICWQEKGITKWHSGIKLATGPGGKWWLRAVDFSTPENQINLPVLFLSVYMFLQTVQTRKEKLQWFPAHICAAQ